MIDRFGKPLYAGWSQTEIIWVEAAMTLKGQEKFDALWDVSAMTGRTYAAVLAKVAAIRYQREADRIAKQLATKRAKRATKLAVNGTRPRTDNPLEPSQIRPLSKAELMRGRAA